MLPELRHDYLIGPIVMSDRDGRCALHDRIWEGPRALREFTVAEHDAKFVLLVEKHTIFARLAADQFHRKNACLLACGAGYPSHDFRCDLRRLHDQLQLPFFVLADNDPAGYLLFFLIARGVARRDSKPKQAIAIPEAAFLGLRTRDTSRLDLEPARIDLRESEFQQLRQFRENTWLQPSPQWQEEFDQLLDRKTKVEMEGLSVLSWDYLSGSYLPERLAAGDHLYL